MKYSVKLLGDLQNSQRQLCIVYTTSFSRAKLEEIGVHILVELPFIKAFACELTKENLQSLELCDECAYIATQSTVSTLKTQKSYNETEVALTPQRARILRANEGSIAFIDTGIAEKPDFLFPKKRIIAFVDFINGLCVPYDDNGHGTFVCGVCTANGFSTKGKIIGTAPCANIVALKAIGGDGEGSAIKILEAMQWIFDNAQRLRIRVVCMSFGCEPQKNDPLVKGANALIKKGIIVVGASGNNGDNIVLSPAIAENVITVGAVDKNGDIAKFTSIGIVDGIQKPEFFAQGVEIEGLGLFNDTVKMSGTSVACPYVSGRCFEMMKNYNKIPPSQVKRSLYNIADERDGVKIIE